MFTKPLPFSYGRGMSTRTVTLYIARNDTTATVQVPVLSEYRGRDRGYYQNEAHFNDDPSEVEVDTKGTVLECDPEFPAAVGASVDLTDAEVSYAEETALNGR